MPRPFGTHHTKKRMPFCLRTWDRCMGLHNTRSCRLLDCSSGKSDLLGRYALQCSRKCVDWCHFEHHTGCLGTYEACSLSSGSTRPGLAPHRPTFGLACAFKARSLRVCVTVQGSKARHRMKPKQRPKTRDVEALGTRTCDQLRHVDAWTDV